MEKTFRCCRDREEVAVWNGSTLSVHGVPFECRSEAEAKKIIRNHLRLLPLA